MLKRTGSATIWPDLYNGNTPDSWRWTIEAMPCQDLIIENSFTDEINIDAIRAYVLAHLSGMIVIGAAGGQFWNSKNELRRTLQEVSASDVLFFPDGCADNCGCGGGSK